MKGTKRRVPQGTREARVQYIEGLMREFTFVRGKTVKDLAKQWGVGEQYCRELTAEASRRIAAAIMDPDTVNAKVGSALDRIITEGMATGKHREVIEAAKAWAHISGSAAPTRQELTGKDGSALVGPLIFIPPEDDDAGTGTG